MKPEERERGDTETPPERWWQKITLTFGAIALALVSLAALQIAMPGLIWKFESGAKVTDWALVFLTAGYVSVASLQFFAMKRTLYAVTRQARISRDAERRELRAYVSVVGVITDINDLGPPRATLMVKNSGKTPAYRLRVLHGIKYPNPPVEADLTNITIPQSTNDLGPGDQTAFFPTAPRPLTDAERAEIRGGGRAIYVYGIVTYLDAFRKQRFTKFRFMTGGVAGVRGNILSICEEGNESD